MKEIKSVRVRRRDVNYGTLDIKVTIFEEKNTFKADERILVGTNNDRPVWIATTYRKKDLYKDYTDDQFIKDFIDMNSKSDGGGKTYDIIQDPWEIKTPKWRSYGYDPYYLNNGAQIFISWTEGNFTAGGLTYSDDSGKEINASVSISKTVFNIIGIDEPSMLQYGKSQEIEYKSFDKPTQVYGGLVEDLSIIRDVISAWKRKVPNYDELALCSPDNQSCSIIPYKSPLKPPEPEVPPTVKVAVNEPPKEKMTVVLPPDVVKVKSDITSFVVYVGKVKEKELLENPSVEQDEFVYDDSPGIDEYTESEFIGEDERQAEGIDDEPVGSAFDEELARENSNTSSTPSNDNSTPSNDTPTPRGNAPIKGSKLTNAAGTSMINLAGHRLTPILKDLENYLNKNGYPGTKIGNNGVMRDLRGSAYPSSPARATASLHGVGLAIDVIFKIPGFKWASIYDNANLARDSKLTQTIAAFIKGQSDIYWGASFGKSNPTAGEVKGRGITEYHHFEIKSDLIPGYWEPVKDELAKLGFKPTDLKSPGKGRGLHRLMLKLLGDSA